MSSILLNNYKKRETYFIIISIICNFLIMVEVSIAKPVINSIFLNYFSSKYYPLVWIISVPLNFFVIIVYNRFIKKLGCFRLFFFTSIFTALLHSLLAACVTLFPVLAFLACIWKDIYILLIFHQLWAIIHSTIAENKAKYLYGLFFGIGSLGGALGGVISSSLAVKLGSQNLLLFSLPIYSFLLLAYHFALQSSKVPKSPDIPCKGDLSGINLIIKSKHLKLILVTVVFMQLSVTIMDYKFNQFLEVEIPDQDFRTQFCGKLWFCIENAVFILQFFATFLLIRCFGVKKSQLFLPLAITLITSSCLVFQNFLIFACSFGLIKAFDYSIFHIVKENNYVSLNQEEKFRARSLIDVFAYRSTKGIAAIIISFLQSFSFVLTWVVFFMGIVWVSLTYALSRNIRMNTRGQKQDGIVGGASQSAEN